MKTLLIALAALLWVSPLHARTLDGTEMPDRLTVGEQSLTLNGAGIRSKWFVNLYVAGLYLPEVSSDAGQIVESAQTQVIRLHIISDMITSERMREATVDGFRKSTNGHLEKAQPQLDRFLSMFDEKIQEGDVFELRAIRGKGIAGYKNGHLIHEIEGHTFKEQVFGIWLSDEPIQEPLKNAMLGAD